MKTSTSYLSAVCTVALGLAALLPMTGCGRGKSTASEEAQPAAVTALAVRTHSVTNRVFERQLMIQGTLEAKRYANVAARVGGNLDALWVDEGDVVEAGITKLFQIDPVSLSNALVIAEQSLNVSRANLAVAEASRTSARAEARKVTLDFERYGRLHKEGRVSANEFETAQTRNEQAQAGIAVADAQIELAKQQIAQAETALSTAKKNLEDSLMLAPLSGVVSRRLAEPGEQMAVGTVVLRIVDLATVEAAAFLPAQYYADVTPGETSFRLGISGKPAGEHTITYRSPTINPTLRTFEIKGLVDDTEGLAVPGAMVNLTIVFESREGVGAPIQSVLTRAGRSVVFVVRDGKAVQTPVETGLQNGTCFEILSGLAPNDQVVVEGQTLLSDGQAVQTL